MQIVFLFLSIFNLILQYLAKFRLKHNRTFIKNVTFELLIVSHILFSITIPWCGAGHTGVGAGGVRHQDFPKSGECTKEFSRKRREILND